ncbi:hypothetical protein CLOSBL3_12126 [Clostridiaceae bacterium BL-3]|nr:hypothetical protein CLOSBL3_12126 [Clostridiaceae bacterium BL-3]
MHILHIYAIINMIINNYSQLIYFIWRDINEFKISGKNCEGFWKCP